MYFWNIKKLNKDLVKGLEQKEDAKYLLVYLVVSLSLLFFPTEGNKYDMISAGIEIVFGVAMLFILFQINNSNKGQNFLSRYFAIGWVTFIRSSAFILLPLLITGIIALAIIYGEDIPEQSGIEILIYMVLYLSGYAYLNIKYWKQLMKKIEKKK